MNFRLVAILWRAISEVARNWRPLIRVSLVPAGGSVFLTWFWIQFGGFPAAQWVYVPASMALYTLFATSCHRVILLGEGALPNKWGLCWTIRETRFLGWLIAFAAFFYLLSWPIGYLVFLFPNYLMAFGVFWYLQVIIFAYFEGRLGMVLPATATDQPANIADSWNLTRGNGFIIAIALFLTGLAMTMVDNIIVRMFSRDALIFGQLIAEVAVYPFIAVAVGVLSVTYRWLTNKRNCADE